MSSVQIALPAVHVSSPASCESPASRCCALAERCVVRLVALLTRLTDQTPLPRELAETITFVEADAAEVRRLLEVDDAADVRAVHDQPVRVDGLELIEASAAEAVATLVERLLDETRKALGLTSGQPIKPEHVTSGVAAVVGCIGKVALPDAKFLLALVRQELAKIPRLHRRPGPAQEAPPADGPVAPSGLRFKGQVLDDIPALEWRLLNALWQRRSLSVEDALDALYGGDSAKENALKSVKNRLNRRLMEAVVPLQVREKNGSYYLDS